MSISFEKRVLEVITSESVNFKNIFIDKEYLIASKDFIVDKYYILSANEDNFLHLTGVKTVLGPKKFFEKANSKTLSIKDFSIPSKQIKGTVRKKIKALPKLQDLFKDTIFIQERFSSNNVYCDIVTGDGIYILGFIKGSKCIPKTLLYNKKLDNPKKVFIVLSKDKKDDFFSNVIYGDELINTEDYIYLEEFINIEIKDQS